jgi:hypothetical protein
MIHLRSDVKRHKNRILNVDGVCFLNCLELLRILSSIFSFKISLFILVLCPPRIEYLTRSCFYAILRVCENNRRCDLLSRSEWEKMISILRCCFKILDTGENLIKFWKEHLLSKLHSQMCSLKYKNEKSSYITMGIRFFA